MAGRYIKVRVEEVAIGAVIGVGTGLAIAAPFTTGLPTLDPLAPGLGAWGIVQAAVLWLSAAVGGGLGAWWSARQERDGHVRGARYYADYREGTSAMQIQQFSLWALAPARPPPVAQKIATKAATMPFAGAFLHTRGASTPDRHHRQLHNENC